MLVISPEIKLIGFDLDDTLHSFRKASKQATSDALLYLSRYYSVPLDDLQSTYADILKNAQSKHFTENKPSNEYRAERFRRLFDAFQFSKDDQLEILLEVYDQSISRHLELKDGAFEVLKYFKDTGKTIIIISEGPHDAQELTLKRLGVSPYIVHLFTSSKYETSKTDGLFEIVLEQIGCKPDEMLYVGDHFDRDYLSAKSLGINAVWFDEVGQDIECENKITCLRKLIDLVK